MQNNLNRRLYAASILLFSSPAYAYLDPGTGSIILQAIIAAIVVGFATLRIWWDKLLTLLKLRKKNSLTQEEIQNPPNRDVNKP
ncbi:hypothetical protein [Shewanella algidipiscicola]|uniref:Holin n=1 Tax=Shewanella algidipiscicola TaxID=614070 RepID=A0ABQ4PHQ3_9GAMM|nr:hypothetical protein [Shewanella algidipiscicola]GIU46922.1 hypothetical protein TUM4630_18950 [Shewanella algidipiscicola]